jgi:hypothetical protein
MARNKKRDSGQQIIANMGLFWEVYLENVHAKKKRAK